MEGVSAHIATSKDSLVLPVTADGVRVWTLSPSTAACEYSPWENFNTWDKVFTTNAGICSLIYTSKKKKLETIPIFFLLMEIYSTTDKLQYTFLKHHRAVKTNEMTMYLITRINLRNPMLNKTGTRQNDTYVWYQLCEVLKRAYYYYVGYINM